MKYSVIPTLLLSLVISWVEAQSTEKIYTGFKPDTTNTGCIELMKQADSIFAINKDTIKLKRSIPFSDTQGKVLKNNYNINAAYPLIFIDDCFNYRLKQLANTRFGMDVMAISEKLADSLDKAGFGNLYERPVISPENGWLSKYIKQSLSKKQLAHLKKALGYEPVYVGISIDTSGVCHLLGVTIKSKPSTLCILKLSKIINNKKLFSPRIVQGHAVKTEEWILLQLTD